MEALLLVFGGVAFVMVLLIYSSFSWAFVASKLYIWFILSIPAFNSAPRITFMQWVGIMLFISVFAHRQGHGIKDEYKESTNKTAIGMMLAPWITFIVAWLFKAMFF